MKSARSIAVAVAVIASTAALVINTVTFPHTASEPRACPTFGGQVICDTQRTYLVMVEKGFDVDFAPLDLAGSLATGILAFLLSAVILLAWRALDSSHGDP